MNHDDWSDKGGEWFATAGTFIFAFLILGILAMVVLWVLARVGGLLF